MTNYFHYIFYVINKQQVNSRTRHLRFVTFNW